MQQYYVYNVIKLIISISSNGEYSKPTDHE